MIGFSAIWGAIKTVERLVQLEVTHGASIEALRQAVAELDRRIQRLENREDVTVKEAKAAARAASHEATQGAIGDLIERVTRLEVLGGQSLPPSALGNENRSSYAPSTPSVIKPRNDASIAFRYGNSRGA